MRRDINVGKGEREIKKKVRKRNNSERGEERKRSPKVITSNVTRLKRIPQFGSTASY